MPQSARHFRPYRYVATALTVAAHDTIVFKNIEKDSVANLLQMYMQTTKQSFVALDEIEKYGAPTAAFLRDPSVIQLDDEHVSYSKE